MSKCLAIQMDAIDSINVQSDTSYVLALEAQRRGYELWHYLPEALMLEQGVVKAYAHPLTLFEGQEEYFRLGEPALLELASCDVVLVRQDPPFDMAYLTSLYLLDMIADKTQVLNRPSGVMRCTEKLFACQFPDLMPATLVTRASSDVEVFFQTHQNIVLKPLYAFGGEDIIHITSSELIPDACQALLSKYQLPFMAQQFIPEVTAGDKRIILINGDPAGAVLRVPPKGEIRSNLILGGEAQKTELTASDKKICARLKPILQSHGLFLTGIDVIAGYLTEINVTSPTGIQAINRLDGVKLEALFWDSLEAGIN